MKAAVAVAIVLLAGLTPAFGQTFQDELYFYPEVPTQASNVVAHILLTAPTPCHEVTLQDFKLSDGEISINVEANPPPPGTACIMVLKQHSLTQEIGRLDAGAYTARLYVNGQEKASTKLYVTEYDVAVLATGKFADEQGGLNLVGEVQNTGNKPIRLTRIDVSFFDGNQLQREEQAYTTMATIIPNMTSGFSIPLNPELQDKEYSVRVTSYNVAEEPERALRLVVEPAAKDGYGTVSGHVLNGSERDAKQVKIVCAAYKEGRVVDSIFGYTNPPDIPAGQSAGFEILTHYKTGEFLPSCNAEAQGLAVLDVQVVPEFPTAVLMLTASLGVFVYLFRNRH